MRFLSTRNELTVEAQSWKPRVELSQERDILVDSLVNQQFLKKIVNSRGPFQSYLFGSYQDSKDAVNL